MTETDPPLPRPLATVVEAVRSFPIPAPAEDPGVSVTGVVTDSREVRAGSVFCCIRGANADGHAFAPAAVAAGASALLVDHRLDLAVPQIVVPDVRAAVGPLAAAFHGHPSDSLTTVGITGTNGKTTTAALIGHVLDAVGMPTDVFGTLSGSRTTPEAPEVQHRLAAARDAGRSAVVMEVSSHALALHRVDGARFDVAVFTNLGRDHLDLHGTRERYFAAKARLFEAALSDRGVVNGDDVHGRLLIDAASIPVTSYSLADASGVVVTATSHRYRWRGVDVSVPLGGEFNVLNSLAAATACAELGIEPADVAAALATTPPVPGRFESVDAGQPFTVLVDYAHTPDGLAAALRAARASAPRATLIVVFGCGGDREREKRPEMGEVASVHADRVVLTSDNPRSEDPLRIINATLEGVPHDYRDRVVIEPDRERAIAVAMRIAAPGDVVLIAGKGHEATQRFADREVPFDDRVVARDVLSRRGGHP